MRPAEVTLATLPSTVDDQRVVVVLVTKATGQSEVELRQQSHGDGVGWFTQSTVSLTPEQVGGLKGVLPTQASRRAYPFETRGADRPRSSFQPRLFRAESA